ncbi:DNA (cytosine-5-)-methyltransferase [Pseudoflavitalea sp. X16]|uniref:DNA cytosine methyltransferase n=1 Tax=Paraflavitalea devenefica TaxID=2716334 RepID=UPI00141EF150|nr:DNA (cytosine-5-)-methyltransferase [Paraflavitalea devenefica]NII26132.1 DNA (cytosine-5-)-methyltransferase [Paraflavitalea devenefica]
MMSRFLLMVWRKLHKDCRQPTIYSPPPFLSEKGGNNYGSMRHGSLFSGIGGFDLAAAWMGWENVFFCEIDPFCRVVLQKYWPHATCIENIEQFPTDPFSIDVLSGGFPCQAFSVAGKRKGIADSRYLWPAMFNTIKRLRPPYVVAENVVGLISWEQGMVFEQVHLDLESEGYQVWTFVLPAVATGAPHVRSRVWFLGYNPANDHRQPEPSTTPSRSGTRNETGAAHTDRQGLEGATGKGQKRPPRRSGGRITVPVWDHWPAESPVCQRDDGLPARLSGITFPRWRNKSIMALGNAIVPQVALRIFTFIAEHRAHFIEKPPAL